MLLVLWFIVLRKRCPFAVFFPDIKLMMKLFKSFEFVLRSLLIVRGFV